MHAQVGIRRVVSIGLATLALGVLGAASFMPVTTVVAPEAKPDTARVTVTATGVTVSPATVRTGNVMLMVMNSSSATVDFELDGPDPNGEADAELDDIAVGETRSATISLRAGTYRLEAEDDDDNNERRATLTVR